VFIRPESPDAKANELDFVYVNTHMINKFTSLCVYLP
jgi:hypothetical protein